MTAMDVVLDPVLDSGVPLCFDTSAVPSQGNPVKLLLPIRERFPGRRLLIPAWVVAEAVRQLRAKHGDAYRDNMVAAFLDNPELNLEVVGFERATALGAWPQVAGRFADADWRWELRPLPEKRRDQPCAQRCRAADHAILAAAVQARAVLVSDDDELRREAANAALLPAAVSVKELRHKLS